MSSSDFDQEKALREQELNIQRQIAFASGLFQGDITIRTLLESLGEGVVIIDVTGTILLVNTRAEQMFGYLERDLVGKPHSILIPEQLRKVHEVHEAQFFEEPRIRPMGQLLDLTGRRRDGSEFPLEISLSYIETINGVFALAFVSDITLRKQAEEAIRTSEKMFSKVFQAAPTLIGISTLKEGRFIDINRTALQTLGYRREEIIGKTVHEIGLWEDESVRAEVIKTMEAQGSIQNLEIRFKGKNGQVFTGLFSAELIELDGERYMISLVRDITDQIHAREEIERLNTDLAARAVELEAVNRELETFNFTVAHDLRQPLNVINSYCQVIQELCGNNLDDECKGYLREVYGGTLRMDRLISALLKFSRLGHVEMHPGKIDLSSLARTVAAELHLPAPDRRVTFRISESMMVNGDPTLLRVVLENLLGNAWKYTGTREEALIEFSKTVIEGVPTYFIRDNGAGFDMADADKLFNPFQRLADTIECKGFGIGLATVERIIRRHGGRIWAEGKPGKGATFYFTLSARENNR
jgi:PAS domain S-box-containing protein